LHSMQFVELICMLCLWSMPFGLSLSSKRSQPNALSWAVYLDLKIRDEWVGLLTWWGKFCRFWWQRNRGPVSSPEINACIVWMLLTKQLSELMELIIEPETGRW
jgi:hypothetical protein